MKITILFSIFFINLSWGQEVNLKELISKMPCIEDSLKAAEKKGSLEEINYNDSILVKRVSYQSNDVTYYKLIGNWETSKYDKNCVFVKVKNHTYIFSPNYQGYKGFFTFDIVSDEFTPEFRLTVEDFEIKGLAYYKSINEQTYLVDNYYIGCKSNYSVNDQFYFNLEKLHDEINLGGVHPVESTFLVKKDYVRSFLNLKW